MPLPQTNISGRESSNGRDLSSDLWLLRVDPGGLSNSLPANTPRWESNKTEDGSKEHTRSSSSPYEDALEFFLELVPHGELTPHLYNLKQGDTLLCRKIAKGRFTLRPAQRPRATPPGF